MSIILDNTVGNFAAWQLSIFENASRLKYGQHAVHLSASLGAPTFWEPPNADEIAVHGNYEYEYVPDPAIADPQPLLMGIPGRLTISGRRFFAKTPPHTTWNSTNFNNRDSSCTKCCPQQFHSRRKCWPRHSPPT